MISRLVVLAVLAVAAAAVVDGLRSEQRGRAAVPAHSSAEAEQIVRRTAGLAVVENRVLLNGAAYLSSPQIRAGFPAALEGSSFELAHVAAAPDGTLALATYNFPFSGPPANAIELWRGSELVSSFAVPPGSFGGGLGFSRDGALVAAVSPDGLRATLYDRGGRRVESVPLTSWTP